jgi:hypothetical protein
MYRTLILAIILNNSIPVYPAVEFVKLYKWLFCLTSEEVGKLVCAKTECCLQLWVKNSSSLALKMGLQKYSNIPHVAELSWIDICTKSATSPNLQKSKFVL